MRVKMKFKYLIIFLVIIVNFFANTFAKDILEEQGKALDLIVNFSKNLCNSVPIQGERKEVELTAEGKVAVGGLLKKISGIHIESSGKYDEKQTSYKGVLQKELAKILSDSEKCKERITKLLIEKMVRGNRPTLKNKENIPEYYGVYARLLNGELVELNSVNASSSRVLISGRSASSGEKLFHYVTETPKIKLDMENVDEFILYGDEKGTKPEIVYFSKMSHEPKAFFKYNNGNGTRKNSFLNIDLSCGEANGLKRKKIKEGMYAFKYPSPKKSNYKYCDLTKTKRVTPEYLEVSMKIDFYGWWYDKKYWIFYAENENKIEKQEELKREMKIKMEHEKLLSSIPNTLKKLEGVWVGKNSANFDNLYTLTLSENKAFLAFEFTSYFGSSSSTKNCKNEYKYSKTKDKKLEFTIIDSRGCRASKYIELSLIDNNKLLLITNNEAISSITLVFKSSKYKKEDATLYP